VEGVPVNGNAAVKSDVGATALGFVVPLGELAPVELAAGLSEAALVDGVAVGAFT